jgi:hypothetical protein
MLDFSAFDNKNDDITIFNSVVIPMKYVNRIMIVASSLLFLSMTLSALLNFGQGTAPFLSFRYIIGQLAGIIFFIFIALVAVFGVAIATNKMKLKISQLKQFSDDNSFTFSHRDVISSDGALFKTYPEFREIKNIIKGTIDGNPFRVFSYYVLNSSKNKLQTDYGVAEITLPVKFPHIILDNKLNPSLNSSHADNNQQMKLGNVFDKKYTAYGPQEYEIEVLQVLSPQLVEYLSSSNYPIDFEFIGNHLYLYTRVMDSKQAAIFMFSAISQTNTATLQKQKTFKMVDNIGSYLPSLKNKNLRKSNRIKKANNIFGALFIVIVWLLFLFIFIL